MTTPLPDDFLRVPLAHRALHDVSKGRPENSIAAIKAAMEAGYGIEIDVQLSADDEGMVFHDYALERLSHGLGAVRLKTARELAAIPLRGAKEEFIPTLAQVLDVVGGRVPLLIEVKDQDGAMGPNVGILERAVARAIRDYRGPVAVMSFNPHSVTALGALLPDVPRGIVTSAYRPSEWPLSTALCDHLREIPDYEACGASFVSHEVDDLDRARLSDLKARGAAILCWTVTSQTMEDGAREYADNITFEQYEAACPP